MAGPMPKVTFLKGQSKNPIVPGVCLIDDKFKFFFNKIISDGSGDKPVTLFYLCSMKKSSKCPASVVLFKEGDKWWTKNLSSIDEHNHVCEKSDILAHKLKKDILSKVKDDPTVNADTAYRTIITEYEDQYAGNDENVWDDAIGGLTDKENIARNVRRVRSKMNGPLSKTRNDFQPEPIVKNTLGGQKVVVLDSNKYLDRKYTQQLKDFMEDKNQEYGLLDSFLNQEVDVDHTSREDS